MVKRSLAGGWHRISGDIDELLSLTYVMPAAVGGSGCLDQYISTVRVQ